MSEEAAVKTNKKNIFLDIYKIILSFFVMTIHFPNSDFPLMVLFARIAVPSFFIISGFFMDNWKLDDHDRLLRGHKSFIKNLVFNAIPFLITLLAIGVIMLVTGEYIYLINHFWFVRDLLAIIAIYLILIRFKKEKIFYIIAIPLLILNFLFGDYSAFLFGEQLSIFVTMNGLFTGIPFFTVGLLLKRYISKINWKILPFILLIGIGFFVLIPFEANWINMAHETTVSLSISVSLSSIFLTTFVLYLPSFNTKEWYSKYISNNLTRNIYAWHLLIGYIFILCGYENIFVFFFVTTAFSLLYDLLTVRFLNVISDKIYSLVIRKQKNQA